MEVYDPAVDGWVQKKNMPIPRYGLSTSVVKGKIYLIGGIQIRLIPLATVVEYTPEGWPFSVSFEGKLAITWGEIKRSW